MRFILLILFFSVQLFAVDAVLQNDKLKVGRKATGDKFLEFEIGSSPNNPKLKWNSSAGALQYANDGSTFKNLGSGSGGGTNYINNADAESGVSGYSAYLNTAQATPVSGTGGSPTVTITQTTSSPLNGLASFLITKTAANSQGQGVSVPFSIESSDLARPIGISFNYNPGSGFVSGNSSDLTVWVYDVTNSVLIPVAPYTIQGGSIANYKFSGSFQSSPTSKSYRLILHVATTNASAWTFKFDNVSVGSTVSQLGSAVMDWQSYTPTWGSLTSTAPVIGNGTINGFYRRVGDSVEVQVFLTSGTTTTYGSSGVWYFSMPPGTTADLTKTQVDPQGVGRAFAFNNPGSPVQFGGTVTLNTGGTQMIVRAETGGAANWNSTNPVAWTSGAGNAVSLNARFPVSGWSSATLISSDTDTRLTALAVNKTSAQTLTTVTSAVTTWATPDIDTHAGFNTSTGVYTVPVSGTYRVSFQLVGGSNGSYGISATLVKNSGAVAVAYGPPNSVSSTAVLLTTDVVCVAGDTLGVQGAVSTGTQATNANTRLSIVRSSGPASVAASESVNAKYLNQAGTSITNTPATIPFATKVYDTHNAFSPSTGIYTCPVSGKYHIASILTLAATTATTTQYFGATIVLNSSTNLAANQTFGNGASNAYRVLVEDTVGCSAGSTISVYALNANTAALSTVNSYDNVLTIDRVGN